VEIVWRSATLTADERRDVAAAQEGSLVVDHGMHRAAHIRDHVRPGAGEAALRASRIRAGATPPGAGTPREVVTRPSSILV